jgi:GAF domain-containing protein
LQHSLSGPEPLCAIDSQPRRWTTDQLRLLSDIAASVVTEISLAQAAGENTR